MRKSETMGDIMALVSAWADRGLTPGTMAGGMVGVACALAHRCGIPAEEFMMCVAELLAGGPTDDVREALDAALPAEAKA